MCRAVAYPDASTDIAIMLQCNDGRSAARKQIYIEIFKENKIIISSRRHSVSAPRVGLDLGFVA